MPLNASESATPAPVSVAVVGAGLAGLTAALRLAKEGYKVTIYEESDVFGGNFSSHTIDRLTEVPQPDGTVVKTKSGDIYHDVYPHIFADWYVNFWSMIENDLGLKRDGLFESRMGVKVLPAPPDAIANPAGGPLPAPPVAGVIPAAPAPAPNFLGLDNPSTAQAVWKNLRSGVLPSPETFLVAFSILDLVSQPSIRDTMLQRLTVDGFLYSQRYATDNCADLHDMILMEIWSIHASQASAAAYKTFFKHAFVPRYGKPFAWLLRGSLQEKLIAPLVAELRSLKCDIHPSTKVKSIEILESGPRLMLENKTTRVTRVARPTDHVVLAVPPEALASLVATGAVGLRLVDKEPSLSELKRLRSERIPVVNLYFKRQLSGIPKEHVGLARSDSFMTFLDISQLWPDLIGMQPKRTVLVLAASDVLALPPAQIHKQAFLMIQKLHQYLPVFNPGKEWGDVQSDISWEESWIASNDSNKLFISEVGSDEWRPDSSYDTLPNVVFAGDFCNNGVGMATIESAVVSGIQAAQAVQARSPHGRAIVCAAHEGPSEAQLLAAKLALLPVAYLAKGWSTVNDAIPHLARRDIARGVILPGEVLMEIPFNFAVDWWVAAYGLCKQLLQGDAPASTVLTAPPSAPAPQTTEQAKPAPDGLAAAVANASSALNHLLESLAAHQVQVVGGPPSIDPPIGPSALAVRLWRAAQSAQKAGQAPAAARPYRRRWRAKS